MPRLGRVIKKIRSFGLDPKDLKNVLCTKSHFIPDRFFQIVFPSKQADSIALLEANHGDRT